jgi:AcrR family transcriptional regulator
MPRKPPPTDLSQRILLAALDEADRVGWPALRLSRVAAALDIPLSEIYRHYRDADAMAEAWLAVADRAMLAPTELGFARLAPADRVQQAMLRWLDALAPYRRVTGDILLGKLYPGHPHHVAALVFRLSRTVQWLREAALLDAPPPRRQLEEIGLTALFAATVTLWARDESDGQATTRRFLGRCLVEAGHVLGRLTSICPARTRGTKTQQAG